MGRTCAVGVTGAICPTGNRVIPGGPSTMTFNVDASSGPDADLLALRTATLAGTTQAPYIRRAPLRTPDLCLVTGSWSKLSALSVVNSLISGTNRAVTSGSLPAAAAPIAVLSACLTGPLMLSAAGGAGSRVIYVPSVASAPPSLSSTLMSI